MPGQGGYIGHTDPQSSSGSALNTFETVSKNIEGYPYALNYTGDQLTTIVYTTPDGTITKTLAYSGSKLITITLSGDTPAGIDLIKTLSYTGDALTSIAYS